MFIRNAYLLLLLAAFFSCKRREEEKPGIKEYAVIELESNMQSEIITIIPFGQNLLTAYNQVNGTERTPAILVFDKEGNVLQKKVFDAEKNFEVRELLEENGQLLLIGKNTASTTLWVLRTDAQFNILNRNTLPVSGSLAVGRSIITDRIEITGFADFAGTRDGILIKLDKDLSKASVHHFGGAQNESSVDLSEVNGTLYMLAYTYSAGAGDRDFWWLKWKDTTIISEKTFGTSGYEEPQKMICVGKDLYLAGHTNGFGHPEHNAYLIKCDTQGGLIWEKNYGGEHHDGFQWVQRTVDGNLLCAGRSMQHHGPMENVYLVRTDTAGILLSERRFGEENLSENPTGALEAGGRFFVAVNTTDQNGSWSGKIYHLAAF